jgi:hypothetical protein
LRFGTIAGGRAPCLRGEPADRGAWGAVAGNGPE